MKGNRGRIFGYAQRSHTRPDEKMGSDSYMRPVTSTGRKVIKKIAAKKRRQRDRQEA